MKRYLSPRYALPAVAAFLTCLLLFGVISHMTAISSGKEIAVKARGYDPRAILLGHYVRLTPEAEALLTPEQSAEIESTYNLGDELWTRNVEGWVVFAETESGLWEPQMISEGKPRTTDNHVGIFTEVSIYPEHRDDDIHQYHIQPWLSIDRYYANQREALMIEEMIRNNQDVRLLISVTSDGKAHLKGVEANGNRMVMSWW